MTNSLLWGEMMIALEQARSYLDQLGLIQAAEILESRLTAAAQKEISYAEFLADLLGVEVAARRQRYLTARTRLAHFPYLKTLEEFDFGFQPSIDERQVRELATLAFAADAANVILLGPPGVGKTHLAVALGLKAIENGLGVYFVKAHDLLEDLRKAQAEHRLDRRMRVYLAPKVLIIDEFGVWPYDRTAATALFALNYLLDAWKCLLERLRDAHLLLVGGGDASTLQRRVEQERISRVHFLGHRRDVPAILQATDIAVLVSRREGLPRSLMEAMASGKPVVATNIRGSRDLVEHGRSGFLVDLDDVAALAESIERLALDAELRTAMGIAGRERIQEYGLDRVLKEMSDLYTHYLSSNLRS